MKTDKEGKPVPRAEKYKRADGTEVHREYHRADDIPLPTVQEMEEGAVNVILHGKSDFAKNALKKHFTKKSKNVVIKKLATFEGLFRDTDIAVQVKDIFEEHNYTINGKWQGLSGTKTELLAAYYVLKDYQLLKPGKITPQARIFYKEFGLDVGSYISERALTEERYNNDYLNFQSCFKFMLPRKV